MTARADNTANHTPHLKAPFDPGDVVTTEHLDAYMDEGRPMLNNYTRHAKIGGGQHGEVYLCYYTNTRYPQGHPDRRVPVAMKSVKRDNPRAKQMKQLRQQRLPTSPHTPLADRLGTTEAKIRKEIAIMKKCRHPHVVRLYEIIDDRMRDKVYMVMEYLAGGEVKWRNDNEEPILTVEQTRRIIRDAVLGLQYLHYQGIIHRDIKPANLLWTADRRQVKIADFGVSHFSYAQRLAAAGKHGTTENPEDPILLDDSDLTRRAGTPSFLAPEIVYEHTNEYPGSVSLSNLPTCGSTIPQVPTSQSLSTTNTQRPPITKAIDIWALGVTLYCLLFGKTPFMADPAVMGSEWSLYNAICNHDWTVGDVMGSDRVPTGGRHPIGQDSEGVVVLHLLDHLLKKDVKARITLEKVKSSRWILRDLPDAEKWLRVTLPKDKINVSVDETSDAMSSVHFRWNWGVVSRRISSLFRRSRDQNPDDQDAGGAVRSDPHVILRGPKGTTPADSRKTPPENNHKKKDKGKHRAEPQPPKWRSSKSLRSKSIERWPAASRRDAASRSTSAIQEPPSSAQGRRGSVTILVGERPSASASSQSSPTGSDRPRARFALLLSSISHWRPNKYAPQSPPPVDSGGPSSTHPRRAGSTNPSSRATRRSEEALRYYQRPSEDIGRPLTVDRRASSWGQGDQPMEFAEVLSFTSSYDLPERDVDIMDIGSGGVCNDRSFVPRTPSRLSSHAATSPVDGPRLNGDGGGLPFGPPCYDDDSSTIASALEDDDDDDNDEGVWQNGSEIDDNVQFEDDDSDDPEENPVTFSPRRRPLSPHPI